jgi:tetratricopeptide (TPR) repeat protein
MSSSAETKPNTGKQAMKAVRNIVIAVAILGGVLAAYSQYVATSKVLKEKRDKVVELVKRDSVKDYVEAAKLTDEALKLRDGEPYFIATKAEVSSILWAEHGMADYKDASVTFSKKSADANINTGPRFTGETLSALGSGNLDEADTHVNALIQKGITTPQIISLIGLVHYRQGKVDLAKNDFKQIETIYSRYGSYYGETLFTAGEFAAAQGAFARALEMSPTHARAMIGKARADLARGERVVDAAKALEELWPSNGEPSAELSPVLKSHLLAARAEFYLANGKAPEAEKEARAAIEAGVPQDPQLALAHYDLGLALAAQKKADAPASFDAAIAAYKAVPRVYFQGSQALAAAGNVAAADALLKKYEDSGLKDEEGYLLAKGDLLVATNRSPEALAAYEEAIKKSNQLNADAFYKKGRVVVASAATATGAAKTKQLNEALEAFGKAIELRERFPDAWRAQAMIFIEAGDAEKFLEKLNMAIKYYKEGRASKTTTDEFLAEVDAKAAKFGGKNKALLAQWKKEAAELLK